MVGLFFLFFVNICNIASIILPQHVATTRILGISSTFHLICLYAFLLRVGKEYIVVVVVFVCFLLNTFMLSLV